MHTHQTQLQRDYAEDNQHTYGHRAYHVSAPATQLALQDIRHTHRTEQRQPGRLLQGLRLVEYRAQHIQRVSQATTQTKSQQQSDYDELRAGGPHRLEVRRRRIDHTELDRAAGIGFLTQLGFVETVDHGVVLRLGHVIVTIQPRVL